VRTGGRGKHNHLSLGVAFRKAKNEIRRRRKNRIPPKADRLQARAGKNSFSQTLSLFARPSGKLKILFKKSSSFGIKTAPDGKMLFKGDFPFVLGLKIESFVLESPVRLFFCFSPAAKIPNFQKESANFCPKAILIKNKII